MFCFHYQTVLFGQCLVFLCQILFSGNFLLSFVKITFNANMLLSRLSSFPHLFTFLSPFICMYLPRRLPLIYLSFSRFGSSHHHHFLFLSPFTFIFLTGHPLSICHFLHLPLTIYIYLSPWPLLNYLSFPHFLSFFFLHFSRPLHSSSSSTASFLFVLPSFLIIFSHSYLHLPVPSSTCISTLPSFLSIFPHCTIIPHVVSTSLLPYGTFHVFHPRSPLYTLTWPSLSYLSCLHICPTTSNTSSSFLFILSSHLNHFLGYTLASKAFRTVRLLPSYLFLLSRLFLQLESKHFQSLFLLSDLPALQRRSEPLSTFTPALYVSFCCLHSNSCNLG